MSTRQTPSQPIFLAAALDADHFAESVGQFFSKKRFIFSSKDLLAPVLTNVGFCPFDFSPPFFASPASDCAALFLFTKAAIPSLPNLADFSFDKHAAYASPSLPSPHFA